MSRDGYDRPALTADAVVFALGEDGPRVLLVQRGKPPFEGAWAFPGGFVELGESPRGAALRELEEETGIDHADLEQLRAFGDLGRDPRGHTVTVAYVAVVAADAIAAGEAGSDAAQVRWWSIGALPSLAFDHDEILTWALERLRKRLGCRRAGGGAYRGLPANLSLDDLHVACRAITDTLGEAVRCR